MLNKYYIVFLLSIVCSVVTSQSTGNYWKSVDANNLSKINSSKNIETNTSSLYELDIESLRQFLKSVTSNKKSQNQVLTLPNLDGQFNNYSVYEAPIMDASLQAKFPNIKSYKGQNINNPNKTIRFSVTPKGVHAMLLGSDNGIEYLNPVTNNIYRIFAKKDINRKQIWSCGVEHNNTVNKTARAMGLNSKSLNDGFLRNYRIAIACTGEYAQFHGGTVSDVISAMTVTMTRVNAIYERDLSVTLTMVDNTSIIFLNASTDPFSNNNRFDLIDESQMVINSNIGVANYDIGHTFSTGAGGLASLGSTCDNTKKAMGITGTTSPIGDAFDVDFVAHELGHQFGAPHVFNGNQGSCSGSNRSSSNAFEPGSGTTIMAYAGICGSDNVQNNSDAYFHQASLASMWSHITSTGACPVNRIPTGNSAPIANAGPNFIIPQGTPYRLTGSSSDPNGTASHTYTWEQFDLGPSGLPTETTVSGPLVRSFEGTNNPTRYIPRLQDLRDTNGSTTWEKLVTVNRNINYRLTVRDNDINGGRTAVDEMIATVTTSAGPFVLTSQSNTGLSWTAGDTETVTWDIAGTNANGINEANVNILLSEDGVNYDIVLAENVPNDGSHDIVVPSGIASVTCRVMVEASNGIFFNINSSDINIGVVENCDNTFSSGTINRSIPDNSLSGLTETINVTENAPITSMSVSVNITHTYVSDLVIRLSHPNGTTIDLWNRNCDNENNINVTFKDREPQISCGSTISGTFRPNESLLAFNTLDSQGEWTLFISDSVEDDTGTLVNWSLELCKNTLSSENTDPIKNIPLTIFPNPNDGSFDLRFTPKTQENILIDIFDLSGRRVYSNKFLSTELFEESIEMNNTQSGIYVIKIQDGSNEQIRKIIVK